MIMITPIMLMLVFFHSNIKIKTTMAITFTHNSLSRHILHVQSASHLCEGGRVGEIKHLTHNSSIGDPVFENEADAVREDLQSPRVVLHHPLTLRCRGDGWTHGHDAHLVGPHNGQPDAQVKTHNLIFNSQSTTKSYQGKTKCTGTTCNSHFDTFHCFKSLWKNEVEWTGKTDTR